MNKITLTIALLVLVLAGCAPVLPGKLQRNATVNVTVEKNVTIEQNVTAEPVVEKNETGVEEVDNSRDLPKKEVVEGELVSFPNLKAVDPDGDPITYTFSKPLNEKGVWKTKDGDAGEYTVTITASDGANVVEQEVLLVVKPKNRAPVIELEEPIETAEGETFVFKPSIIDPENESVTVAYSGWMTSDTKVVGYNESGLHKVILKISDGKSTVTKEVIVTVRHTNRAPELSEIPEKTIKEGEKVTVKPFAKDLDGDDVRVTFDEPLNSNGTWQSQIGDAGEYDITVIANDGELTSERVFHLVVQAVNRAPVIELDTPVLANEGELLQLNPTITDPENEEFTVVYSGWMSSNTKKLSYEDQGNHTVIITARDSKGNQAQKTIVVEVEDLNRAPIFGTGSFN